MNILLNNVYRVAALLRSSSEALDSLCNFRIKLALDDRLLGIIDHAPMLQRKKASDSNRIQIGNMSAQYCQICKSTCNANGSA